MRLALHVDIDGSILRQYDEDFTDMLKRDPEILDGVREKFNEWSKNDYFIVITTARPESSRERTEEQLRQVGLFWHKLVMDYPNAPRGIINDIHPKDKNAMRAFAINLDRNHGMKDLDIDLAIECQRKCTLDYNLIKEHQCQ